MWAPDSRWPGSVCSRGACAHGLGGLGEGVASGQSVLGTSDSGKPCPELWGHAGPCGPGGAVRLRLVLMRPCHSTEVETEGPTPGRPGGGGSGEIGAGLRDPAATCQGLTTPPPQNTQVRPCRPSASSPTTPGLFQVNRRRKTGLWSQIRWVPAQNSLLF